MPSSEVITAEPLLLSTVRVCTYLGRRLLTAATGFYFERGERLFLVTSRHVLYDAPASHFPDRIELVLHTDPSNLTRTTALSIPLYGDGKALWRQGKDGGGEIDVAVIELDRTGVLDTAMICTFSPAHLQLEPGGIGVGTHVLLAGFPLGFYDTVHHLPVVRLASIASSYGMRFQGQGYFLTDARTHRGSSGAPVVMRASGLNGEPALRLLGVHSSRMDMGTRDLVKDESLGLNCAWYADILLTLTADAVPENPTRAVTRRQPSPTPAKPITP